MNTCTRHPVVTYALRETFERKKTNRKLRESYLAKEEEYLRKEVRTLIEREMLTEAKRRYREEVGGTHVIPSYVFEEKLAKKKEEAARKESEFVEMKRQRELEKDIAREASEKAFRMKKFREELHRSKIVPLKAKLLPLLFETAQIGKAELLEGGESTIPDLERFAKIVGFDVEVDQCEEGAPLLVLWKPFPYWRTAFGGTHS